MKSVSNFGMPTLGKMAWLVADHYPGAECVVLAAPKAFASLSADLLHFFSAGPKQELPPLVRATAWSIEVIGLPLILLSRGLANSPNQLVLCPVGSIDHIQIPESEGCLIGGVTYP